MAEDIYKVIFQLEADGKGLEAEMGRINSKYAETTKIAQDQQKEIQKLKDRETELAAARAKTNNPTLAAKYTEEIKKVSKQLQDTVKVTDDLTKKTNKFGEDLGKAFDGTKLNGLNTGLKGTGNAFTDLRKQIKDAKGELFEAMGSGSQAQILAAQQKLGRLTDEFRDLNETAGQFAAGTKFQTVGNLLRDIPMKVLEGDFSRAAEQSKNLLNVTKSITMKEALTGVKDLGSTLFNVGKALLLNPLFLIGAVIVGIITNFKELKNLGGPIGDFFRGIGDVINSVKEGFSRLTDALGLTTNALDKFQEAQLNAIKQNGERIRKLYDDVIKVLRAGGDATEEAEREKLKLIIKSAEDQASVQRAITNRKRNLSKEDIEAEDKAQAEIQAVISDAQTELLALDAAAAKVKADKAKAAAEKRKAAFAKEQEELFQQNIKNQEAIDAGETERIRKEREADKARLDRKQKAFEDQLNQTEKHHQAAEDAERAFEEKEQNAKIKADLEAFRAKQDEIEKEKELRKQATIQAINDIEKIAQATIAVSNQIVSAKINEVDKLAGLQQKRVDQAMDIADKGNAELLELEQKRLDDINKQKEIFVKRQQELATIELIANTAIAISKAAAQGGAAAGITIAAALIALTGGLIQARTIASNAAFYEGGFTGDGNPREESRAVGRRPYTYHKGEFVMDHKKTAQYRDIFEDIHSGNIDLHDWKNKVNAFEALKFMPQIINDNSELATIKGQLELLTAAVAGQKTSLNFNANGFSAYLKNIQTNNDYVRNNLAK